MRKRVGGKLPAYFFELINKKIGENKNIFRRYVYK